MRAFDVIMRRQAIVHVVHPEGSAIRMASASRVMAIARTTCE